MDDMIPNCKKIYLCAPDLSKLAILNGVQTNTVDFHPQVKSYSELSFEVDRFVSINGKLVESNCYNDLQPNMYLYLEDIGYFIMDTPQVTNDGNHEQKSIVAYSAEKEFEYRDWVGIKINYGTKDSMEYANTGDYNVDEYGFANRYVTMLNNQDENLSFLHQILKSTSSKWSIEYVSPELINAKIPFLEIDSENLYAIMTSEVAPRLQCLFVFDYLNFGIRVYHKDALDLDTGIFIGFRNLEKQVQISVDSDSIFTRFSVQGEDGLEFRDVNYGENYIINLDWFATEPYMSDNMVAKYQAWKQFRADNIEDYIELAAEYNELVERKYERTYRVPSDESYWKNWQDMNEEGLTANLNYFREILETLQISVDDRPNSERIDSQGNYQPVKLTVPNNSPARELLEGYRVGVFGNIDMNNRHKFYWTAGNIESYETEFNDYGFKNNDESKVFAQWDNTFTATHEDVVHHFSIAYSPLLQATNQSVPLSKSTVYAYITNVLNNSFDNSGNFSESKVFQVDHAGIDYTIDEATIHIHDLIAGITNNTNSIDNKAEIICDILNLSEINEHRKAMNRILSLIDCSLNDIPAAANVTNKDSLYAIVNQAFNNELLTDHSWYKQRLYDRVNVYGGYYTYCEILEYIIPYIELALSNAGKLDEDKEIPASDVTQNWELYGLEELKGVRDSYLDKMEDLSRYSKAWGEMTDVEKKATGLNYVDEGAGAQYEQTTGRIEYLKMKNALGTESTPGTILYHIKLLEDEIAQIEQDMEDNNAITNEYAIIVKYNVTDDQLDQLTHLPNELIESRRSSVFTERELLTFDTLLRDTDYVNSNILTTSIMSLTEQFSVQRELLADAVDKLVEVSQPQYKFSVNTDNFFRLPEYQAWAAEFAPDSTGIPIGMLKFIHVGLRDDFVVKLRVVGYRWNPCEITSDLTIEFSNMITSRSGRSDLTELLDQANNRGSKNSIRIGNGTAESEQEYVAALMELLKNNSIFMREVASIAGGVTGGTDTAAVQDIIGQYVGGGGINGYINEYITTMGIPASSINVGNITGTDAEFDNLFSKYISSDFIATKMIDADEGKFNELTAKIIQSDEINTLTLNAKQIVGEEGDFEELTAEILHAGDADIKNLIANNIDVSYIKGESGAFDQFFVDHLDVNEVFAENGDFKHLVADEIAASTINANQISAEEGDFNFLFSDSAFINNLTTNIHTSVTSTIDDEYIQRAVIGKLAVGDLLADDIVLSDTMRILSEDGAMVMNGKVLQIIGKDKDGNSYVGIQLGYDASEHPSLIIRDENGAALFTSQGMYDPATGEMTQAKGITADAIADQLIVNDMIKDGTIEEDKLGFQILKQGDSIVIDQVMTAAGQPWFGTVYTEFVNDVNDRISNLSDVTASVDLQGQQVFIQENGTITPESITISAVLKGGAIIDKWYIDDVENTEYVAADNKSITIPSSAIANKRTLVIKVLSTKGLYDIMTLYRVSDGEKGDSPITAVITSSRGELFKTDDTTTLSCTVYKGTTKIPAKSYEWVIYNDDTEQWDVLSRNATLSVTVNSAKIKQRIKCRVDIDY